MHAHLTAAGNVIMASDWMASEPFPEGRSFSLSIECESKEDQTRLFDGLSQGGKVTMPLQDTFWGAHFGMLQDRFGVRWMLNFRQPQA
jgi:PhnB protein